MDQKKQVIHFEFTSMTILKIVLVLGSIVALWYLRAVFFMLFFGFILFSAFDPVVDYCDKRKIPRKLTIFLIYLVLFMVVSLILMVGANAIIKQVDYLSADFSKILTSFFEALQSAFPWLRSEIDPAEITRSITQDVNIRKQLISSHTLSSAFGFISSLTSVLLAVFVVVMVSVYMLDRQDKFYLGLVKYLPVKQQEKTVRLLKKIENGLGAWFVGQLALMFLIGLVTWIAIMIPGLFFDSYTLDTYAVPIALIAGLLEAVPNLGPTIATVIAVFIAIGSGNLSSADPTTVILVQSVYVIIAGILIQNLEAVFVVPAVMKKAVGVDPIVTILSIISAFSVFGVVGALIVIPLVATLQMIFDFYRTEGKEV